MLSFWVQLGLIIIFLQMLSHFSMEIWLTLERMFSFSQCKWWRAKLFTYQSFIKIFEEEIIICILSLPSVICTGVRDPPIQTWWAASSPSPTCPPSQIWWAASAPSPSRPPSAVSTGAKGLNSSQPFHSLLLLGMGNLGEKFIGILNN